MRVTVVVLGDLERSPRMVYHALAFADEGVDVDLVGYAGSVPQAVARESRIHCRLLPEPAPLTSHGIRFLLAGSRRTLRVAAALARALFTQPRPDFVLVQCPPAIPTLFVAWAAARWRSTRLVIDWHNLAYTVLAGRLGDRHPLVRLAERHERTLGRRADGHLCVTQAMKQALSARWGIGHATVFSDRPADAFAPLAPAARAEICDRLPRDVAAPAGDRPLLMVTPTSWGADEDFDLLLDAVDGCEARIAAYERTSGRAFPTLLLLITGRGPRRSQYEARIARRTAHRVHVRTAWFSSEDYPRVLGAACLGVCVHRSSSGLDLPMKILDLFGSGVPVCALDYGACLRELVRDGENGRLFDSSETLADLIFTLFTDHPVAESLDRLRQGALAASEVRWRDGWRRDAWPVLRRLAASGS